MPAVDRNGVSWKAIGLVAAGIACALAIVWAAPLVASAWSKWTAPTPSVSAPAWPDGPVSVHLENGTLKAELLDVELPEVEGAIRVEGKPAWRAKRWASGRARWEDAEGWHEDWFVRVDVLSAKSEAEPMEAPTSAPVVPPAKSNVGKIR